MRPRKVVLCVARNEWKLSVQMFVVQTWGYHPLGATTYYKAREILEQLQPNGIDMLIVNLPLVGADLLLAAAARTHPEDFHTLALNYTPEYEECKFDVALSKECSSPEQVHERIKILTARKRGPKKKPVQAVSSYENLVCSACGEGSYANVPWP
jgi:two-component system, OmpR family, response regulator CpxR